ncbi:cytochrome c biogenesis protein [Frigoriflavimonas asaccharolytica]|uniref:Cytochrome c-type biogenesis protein CcsB n=1 Tax=Frigoriflavimonas asaccharolytica TaxID=2735899 RepID=A0A8J8K5M0_9FLAO|nr:cytochrome c biogenesis protein CcsA [Frigoriflavimonas asaccharolytica]NRS92910.1 cytochrome c-type biogenesis protein CcsB [Frigoriflavimonas asaccharolytica]
MKKLQNIIINTRTTAVLLLLYAFSMAYATFVENDYGTPTAKALIYEAKWFELIMILLIINFIGNIGRYRLLRREKWPVLMFHLSFVLIFIGGAVTRYISYEGIMPIREGKTSNEIITDKNFFKIQIENKGDVLKYKDAPYILASDKPWIAKIIPHKFSANYMYNDSKISVRQIDYVQRKKDSLIVGNTGTEYLHIVSTADTGRKNIYIKSGESKSVNGMLVSFDRKIDGAVEFEKRNGQLYIKTPVNAEYMTMATQAKGTTIKDEYQPLVLRSLYSVNDLKLVVPIGLQTGKLKAFEGDKKKDQNVPDVLTVAVKGPKTTQNVELSVEKGNPNAYKQIKLDGLNIMLGFGPKIYKTPFSIKLDDFVMETYPGSTSPSAYESHVKIIENGKETPYKIYMNNVLNHGGFRFFQSSYDPDRLGTVLSVNHDWWGTIITYIGYTFLFLGLFIIFFWKGSHFWDLNNNLKKVNLKKGMMMLLLLFSFGLNAQNIDMHGTEDGHNHSAEEVQQMSAQNGQTNTQSNTQETVARPLNKIRRISPNEIIAKNKISKEHAHKFGNLLVQNYEGRIVPINTQALDVLRKLYRRDTFKPSEEPTFIDKVKVMLGLKDQPEALTAEQWFLSINTDTESWTMVPLIKVGTKGGDDLKNKTKANDDGYTTLMDLFPVDPTTGNIKYVLEDDYNIAFRKKPAEQSNYDKEVITVNDRVQVFNGFFGGQFLKIVPVKNEPNNTWHSWMDQNFEPDMASQEVMGPYFVSIIDAQNTGDWSKADAELKKLSAFQQTWGKNVVPSETKVKVEVFMNRVNINFKLLIFYTIIASLLMILGFVELFRPSKLVQKSIKILIYTGIVGYAAHFLGLVARWYISGHAPWSNGYEAIIFISWIGISAGLMFYFGFGKPTFTKEELAENSNLLKKRKVGNNALIPAAGFMVAVIMMGFAHGGSALDQQITPLVPVLKSYWLIVHVAIIVSSYGFFALSMVIAVITLIFYIIAKKHHFKSHNDSTLKELTIVSEMSLTIGIFTLTVGNFLGGIWANESWGRYWSWDPKETWAFISIMVYAFVLHMRLVPGLRGRWAFHTAAMFAFCSMVMTYFGVNYYLSGLHSYAAGDPVPIPYWVYLGLAFMITLSAAAFYKFKKLQK